MSELALLVFLGLIIVLWHDSRRVQEIAVARCRDACARAGVQFLDEVAPVWRIRFARDPGGVLRVRRVFTFEYATDHGERRSGSIVMLGRTPVALNLEDIHPDDRTNARFYP